MNLQTKKTVDSQLNPGVTFTLRRFTARRRIERELSIAPLRNKVTAFNAKIRAFPGDDRPRPRSNPTCKRRSLIQGEVGCYQHHLGRAFLVRAEGMVSGVDQENGASAKLKASSSTARQPRSTSSARKATGETLKKLTASWNRIPRCPRKQKKTQNRLATSGKVRWRMDQP